MMMTTIINNFLLVTKAEQNYEYVFMKDFKQLSESERNNNRPTISIENATNMNK